MRGAAGIQQDNLQAHWQGGLLFYTFPHLDKQPGLLHGFSSRLGGVSTGGRNSLDLSPTCPEEEKEHNEENLRRFAQAVGFNEQHLVISQQTHTVNIFEAHEEDAGRGVTRPRGYTDIDGLITATPQLPLMTHHADCPALFFYSPAPQMIGLAHAGWRGTAQNMAQAMVRALSARGCNPARLLAGISPSAGPCCYQVGAEVAEQFANLYDEQGSPARPDETAPGKFMLDLWRANRLLLLKAGLKDEHILIGGLCTVCHPELFFSHRVQGKNRGSMAAVMMLKGEQP